MSVRLHPDLMVAVDVRDSIDWLRHMGDRVGGSSAVDELRRILPRVTIYVDGCVERQDILKSTGLVNVFTGYGDADWDIADYQRYMSDNAQFFVQDSQDDLKYRLNVGGLLNFECNYTDKEFDKVVIRLCKRLLTHMYDGKVLGKFGLRDG